jgi:hypothetical protein
MDNLKKDNRNLLKALIALRREAQESLHSMPPEEPLYDEKHILLSVLDRCRGIGDEETFLNALLLTKDVTDSTFAKIGDFSEPVKPFSDAYIEYLMTMRERNNFL